MDASNMAIKVSIQNRGGKELIKGGLEVSSEVACRIKNLLKCISIDMILECMHAVSSMPDKRRMEDRVYASMHRSCSVRENTSRMQGTVDDLKRAFAKAKPQFYPSRQRFSFPLKAGEKKATALTDGKKLSDFDVRDGTVLIFKDLGAQVGKPPTQCTLGRIILKHVACSHQHYFHTGSMQHLIYTTTHSSSAMKCILNQ